MPAWYQTQLWPALLCLHRPDAPELEQLVWAPGPPTASPSASCFLGGVWAMIPVRTPDLVAGTAGFLCSAFCLLRCWWGWNNVAVFGEPCFHSRPFGDA